MGFGLGFRVFPRLLRKDEAAFQGYSKEQFLGFRVCVCVFLWALFQLQVQQF